MNKLLVGLMFAGAACAQIEIVSGNGQLAPAAYPFDPMVVKAAPGATVYWTNIGRGTLQSSTSKADANGIAKNNLFSFPYRTPNDSFDQDHVTVTANGASADFWLTSYQVTKGQVPTVLVLPISPTLADFPLRDGHVPIKVRVVANDGVLAGHGVPHVLMAADVCEPSMTDADGFATCWPHFEGTGKLNIRVGADHPASQLTTIFNLLPTGTYSGTSAYTPPPAPGTSAPHIAGGNNQSAYLGTVFPLPLLLDGVSDAQSVSWKINQGEVYLGAPMSAVNGTYSIRAFAGTHAGPISMTATTPGGSVIFMLNAVDPNCTCAGR